MKSTAKRVARVLLPNYLKRRRQRASQERREKQAEMIRQLRGAPEESRAHEALASHFSEVGRRFAAHACLRSAAFVKRRPASEVESFRFSDDELLELNHNQFFRFKTLADTLLDLSDGSRFSVLDLGGGDGQLAQFIPQADYFLAEPGTNGLGSDDLPFAPASFDYVVACHVLEHIPRAERERFLDGLMELSSEALILLNPFHDPELPQEEELELYVELMNADWAREHLDCVLPRVEELEKWGSARGLNVKMTPNGFRPFSMASEFMDFYCKKSGSGLDRKIINKYFNYKIFSYLNEKSRPTAFLAVIKNDC